jgi:hypothetical protein
MRYANKSLVRKSEDKRPLGRPKYRWEDVNMCFGETRCADVDWIYLAQDMGQL